MAVFHLAEPDLCSKGRALLGREGMKLTTFLLLLLRANETQESAAVLWWDRLVAVVDEESPLLFLVQI